MRLPQSMSLSPEHRYPSANHLSDDLTNWMRDEEIRSRPDRGWTRGPVRAAFIEGFTVETCVTASR